MRKTIRGTVAVFILSGVLLQWVGRWSTVVLSRLGPPGGFTTTTTVESPMTTAIAEDD